MNTSLRIALCDSDPGDRKQMERLLERESDRRVNTTGVFYTDTFGGVEAIVNAAMVYDVYFLDSTDPVCDSYGIADALRKKGILSPIVYCISTIDYRKSGPELPNTFYMDKPIKTAELTQMIEDVITQKKENHVPTIEMRNNYEAFYVVEKEVLYFEGSGYNVTVHFTDGSFKYATCMIDSLWRDLYSFYSFQIINDSTIINTRYAASIGPMSVTMQDSSKHKVDFKRMKLVKKKMNKYSVQGDEHLSD